MLSKTFVKHFLSGLAVTVAISFGAALVGLGNYKDLMEWARTLGVAEAGAVGSYIVNNLKLLNPDAPVTP